MFWKKKSQPPFESEPPQPQEAPKTDEEVLHDAAASLAKALNTYSEAAYEAAKPQPDPELQAAYNKVNAAEKLVIEGRLAFALGRCLPEHVKYWPSWSQRDDFAQYVGFKADEIVATKSEEKDGEQKVQVVTVDFTFNATRYRLILRDEGMSSAPGDPYRFGEVELLRNDERVARFGLIEDISNEFSRWEFSDVRTLKVGPWMRDILDILAQIEASDLKRRDEFLDEQARAAASEIELG